MVEEEIIDITDITDEDEEEETIELNEYHKNIASTYTRKSTDSSVKIFRLFLKDNGFSDHFESLSKDELENILVKYYAEVRQENGNPYCKSSIVSLRYGLNRYLSQVNNFDIIKDKYFYKSQRVFKSVCNDLKSQGKPAAVYPPISHSDWIKICKYFSSNDLEGEKLLQKVFIDISLHFGKRIKDPLWTLQQDDFQVLNDGKPHVICTRGELDTRSLLCITDVRMYAKTGDPLCPVASFLKYRNHLNPSCSRFFQRPGKGTIRDYWYTTGPLGHNSMKEIMPTVSRDACLSRRYTTHSLRITSIPHQDLSGILFYLQDQNSSQSHQTTSNNERLDQESNDNTSVSSEQVAKVAKALRTFLINADKDPKFENLTMFELNDVLCQFYGSWQRDEGRSYQITSLAGFVSSLNSHLKGPPYFKTFDILKDAAFEQANSILKQIYKESKPQDNDQNQSSSIKESDLNKLYCSKYMDMSTPKGLFNKVHFEIRMLVCHTAMNEFITMRKDHFEISTDPKAGRRFVGKRLNVDRSLSYMYEMPGSPYCPVASYEQYLRKLNPNNNCLWQRAVKNLLEESSVWYYNFRCAEKDLSEFMRNLSIKCQLSKVYDNHSIRLTEPTDLVKVLNRLNNARINVFAKSILCGGQQKEVSRLDLTCAIKQSLRDKITNQNRPIPCKLPDAIQTYNIEESSQRKRPDDIVRPETRSSAKKNKGDIQTCDVPESSQRIRPYDIQAYNVQKSSQRKRPIMVGPETRSSAKKNKGDTSTCADISDKSTQLSRVDINNLQTVNVGNGILIKNQNDNSYMSAETIEIEVPNEEDWSSKTSDVPSSCDVIIHEVDSSDASVDSVLNRVRTIKSEDNNADFPLNMEVEEHISLDGDDSSEDENSRDGMNDDPDWNIEDESCDESDVDDCKAPGETDVPCETTKQVQDILQSLNSAENLKQAAVKQEPTEEYQQLTTGAARNMQPPSVDRPTASIAAPHRGVNNFREETETTKQVQNMLQSLNSPENLKQAAVKQETTEEYQQLKTGTARNMQPPSDDGPTASIAATCRGVNSFRELIANVKKLSGYQIFFQAKTTGLEMNNKFNETIQRVDREWETLNKASKEWYESCAKSLNNAVFTEQTIQTDRPLCVEDNSCYTLSCTGCNTQDRLARSEKQIEDLKRQLALVNSENKQLLKLTLNLKSQLLLKERSGS